MHNDEIYQIYVLYSAVEWFNMFVQTIMWHYHVFRNSESSFKKLFINIVNYLHLVVAVFSIKLYQHLLISYPREISHYQTFDTCVSRIHACLNM